METPRFDSGNNSLIFTNGLQLPTTNPLEKVQAHDRTAAGTLQVEDLGVTFRRFNLVFNYMTAAKYAELESWFDNIANGVRNSFQYTDETGTPSTVRIITNPLTFQEIRAGWYNGELLIEVV